MCTAKRFYAVCFLLASVLLFAGFDASAAQDRGHMLTGFVSKHIGSDQTFCEVNPGLGYRAPSGTFVLAYRNSLCRTSVAVGKEFERHVSQMVTLKAGVGLVTGYEQPVTPLVYPAVGLQLGRIELALGAIPRYKTSPWVAFAQVRYELR